MKIWPDQISVGNRLSFLANGNFSTIYKALANVADRTKGDKMSLQELEAEIIKLSAKKDSRP